MVTAERGLRAGELDTGQRRSPLERVGVLVNGVPSALLCRGNQFAIDAILSAFALYISYQLRFDGNVPTVQQPVMWGLMLLVPVLRPLSILAFGGYDGIWRYFNLRDAAVLIVSSVPPTILLLIVRFGFGTRLLLAGIPATVIVIEYGSYLLLATSVRGFRRMAFEASLRAGAHRRRAVLVGTDHTLAGALRQVSIQPDVEIVGLLAPEGRLHGLRIGGFTVIDGPSALPNLLAGKSVELVLIADASLDCIGATVEVASEFGAEVRLLPSAANVLRGDVRVSATARPELALPDRPGAVAPHPSVTEAFRGRVILITGAGGSIGSEMSRQVAALPVKALLLFDHDENSIFEIHRELCARAPAIPVVPVVGNIRDHAPVQSLFTRYRPDIVLHAAAYKHVPVMEQNCCEAVLNNIIGTRELMQVSLEFGAERFVMISTDKAVQPTSIMGATKRIAELLVQSYDHGTGRRTHYACVRFGNVMGSRGSVVPIFLRQIADGGPITITHAEMTRYFMSIPEAVQLVLEAATLGTNGDIYMLDMGDPVKILTLARKLAQMSGLNPGKDIEIRIVGTRPGEKLHEQLWTEDAGISPTKFPYVFAVHADPAPPGFQSHLRLLEEAALSCDDGLVLDQLEAIPIGFTRQRRAAAIASN